MCLAQQLVHAQDVGPQLFEGPVGGLDHEGLDRELYCAGADAEVHLLPPLWRLGCHGLKQRSVKEESMGEDSDRGKRGGQGTRTGEGGRRQRRRQRDKGQGRGADEGKGEE